MVREFFLANPPVGSTIANRSLGCITSRDENPREAMKAPRFHLRDLFWLVLIVAVGCAWWIERVSKLRAESAAETSAGRLDEIRGWFAHRGYYVSPDWAWIAEPGTWRLVCKTCGAKFDPEDGEYYGDLCERADEAGWTMDFKADWSLCDKCSKSASGH